MNILWWFLSFLCSPFYGHTRLSPPYICLCVTVVWTAALVHWSVFAQSHYVIFVLRRLDGFLLWSSLFSFHSLHCSFSLYSLWFETTGSGVTQEGDSSRQIYECNECRKLSASIKWSLQSKLFDKKQNSPMHSSFLIHKGRTVGLIIYSLIMYL